MFTLTNKSKAVQIVSRIDGKRVVLPPGRTMRGVPLSERTVSRLARGTSVRVVSETQHETQQAETQQAETQQAETQQAETQQAETQSSSSESEALVSNYLEKRIGFGEFQDKAKKLLGDRWPGGTPRKSVILDLLRG